MRPNIVGKHQRCSWQRAKTLYNNSNSSHYTWEFYLLNKNIKNEV